MSPIRGMKKPQFPEAKLWMKSKFMVQTVKSASLMLTSHFGGGCGIAFYTLHLVMQGTQDASHTASVIQSCTVCVCVWGGCF